MFGHGRLKMFNVTKYTKGMLYSSAHR